MKGFIAVFTTGFKYCWRDIVSVIVLTAFPILIILVLGTALGGYISPDFYFDSIPIAAVVERGGNLETFLQEKDVTRFLDITYTDEENARELLDEHLVSVIILEEDSEVHIIRPYVGGFGTSIATSIIDSYMQIGAAMTISLMNGADYSELLNILNADINIIQAPLGNRTQSAIDYYAVTMLVMILMFAGMNGLELFKKGMFSDTGTRALIAPVSKPVLIGGLITAATVTTYLQGMVTFLFCTFVYGVYWGDNIPLVLFTLFGVTLFSQAFALLALLITKSPNAAMAFMQSGIWVMTFTAGGYVKIDFGAAEAVFRYSPNSLAHTVIFGSAFGGNEARMMNDLGLLFIYSSVLFIIAFILGKRRLT